MKRAEELAARHAGPADADRQALTDRMLGERDDGPALGHQGTVDAMLAAFPDSWVVDDWQQVHPGGPWIDRRTGVRSESTPPGAVPLNVG